MIKKICVDQLKPGMYIHDFNCGWLQHPFLRNSASINDERIICKIIDLGIREVYIDTLRGTDVSGAPTKEEAGKEIQDQIARVERVRPVVSQGVPLNEEIHRAKTILKDASAEVRKIMQDVRFGKQLQVEKVEHVVTKMFSSILRNQEALTSLCRIKRVDEYTYCHSISTCALMLSFCNAMHYDPGLTKELGIGSLLHDIGKMMMPEEVLNKRGELSEAEFEMMKGHVEHGRILIEQSGCSKDIIIDTVIHHHEREDGSGYPQGLFCNEISIYGKALAIVDVYDALTSDRCYKYRIEPTEALRKLFEWSKFYFSGELVQKFIQCIGIYPAGTLIRLESGWIGVVVQQNSHNLLKPVVRVIYNTKTENYPRIPFDIDLSHTDDGDQESIINYESPEKWNIHPGMYL